MGALSGGASPKIVDALREFARQFGLGFQLADDLKDKDGMVLLLGRDEVANMAHDSFARATAISQMLGSEGLKAVCEQCRPK
jgi:hypothetical protein